MRYYVLFLINLFIVSSSFAQPTQWFSKVNSVKLTNDKNESDQVLKYDIYVKVEFTGNSVLFSQFEKEQYSIPVGYFFGGSIEYNLEKAIELVIDDTMTCYEQIIPDKGMIIFYWYNKINPEVTKIVIMDLFDDTVITLCK